MENNIFKDIFFRKKKKDYLHLKILLKIVVFELSMFLSDVIIDGN